jgi:transposase
MLKVDYQRWDQSPETLRAEALRAEHPRTRERLIALYEICRGQSATKLGKKTGKNPQTIMDWVHRYNQKGLLALKYQRTGGRIPLFL